MVRGIKRTNSYNIVKLLKVRIDVKLQQKANLFHQILRSFFSAENVDVYERTSSPVINMNELRNH